MTMSLVKTGTDAHVYETLPDRNFGHHPLMALTAQAGSRRRIFAFFARPFPVGAVIIGAILRLFVRGGADGWHLAPHTLTVRRITSRWRESGVGSVTWNNQPTVDGAESVTHVVDDSGAVEGFEIAIDVTDLLQTAAASGVFYGFRIEVDTNGVKYVHSSEATNFDVRPWLEIEWAVTPGAPTDLKPSGGRAVSLAQPTLAWQFGDQSAFQVQISEAADMSAPVHDPGYIASADEAYDLADTAFSLTDGTVYYWRVRAKDPYGLESPWSDVMSFRRDTKGVLTITSPAAAPDNIVADLTPTISHTFTGRTQESIRYRLFRQDSGAWVRIYDSREIPTDLTNHTLPDELITDEGPYRIDVFVFDDLDREATPGDPRHVLASREFTFDCEGLHAGPSTFEVADGVGDDAPGVVLTWHQDADPTAWAVKIGGRFVIPELDVEDTAIGGGDHRYVLWNVTPRVSQVFEVVALNNDEGVLRHSCGNPEVTFESRPKGTWLIAPEYGLRCVLFGAEKANLHLGQSSVVLTATGRRDGIVLVDNIRGYEGTISGRILGRYGRTAAQWRRNFEDLKGLPQTARIRLVIKDLNIPVTLVENEDLSPSAEAGLTVTQQVMQTDEFFRLRR